MRKILSKEMHAMAFKYLVENCDVLPPKEKIAGRLAKILLFLYEKEGSDFFVGTRYLQDRLGTESADDIFEAFSFLARPILFENIVVAENRVIELRMTSFVQDCTRYKEDLDMIEVHIGSFVADFLKKGLTETA